MAGQVSPHDPGAAGKSPTLVRVTVEPGGRGGARPVRISGPGLVAPVVALVAIVALLAGALVAVDARGTSRRVEPLRNQPATQARVAGPAGVAAAYQYPLACLRITIASGDPAYAAARLNRASPCWRYGIYTTAIFRRVAGVWHMALVTPGRGCTLASMPALVRVQLGVSSAPCPRDRS